jgi:hypothetical protein
MIRSPLARRYSHQYWASLHSTQRLPLLSYNQWLFFARDIVALNLPSVAFDPG